MNSESLNFFSLYLWPSLIFSFSSYHPTGVVEVDLHGPKPQASGDYLSLSYLHYIQMVTDPETFQL